jgi:plasmid stability protein
MKTTLEIPDELMREIKVRAAKEDRKLKDLVSDLLRRGLAEAEQPPPKVRHRVNLPLVQGKPAAPGQEMTPERVAQLLIDEEAEWATRNG